MPDEDWAPIDWFSALRCELGTPAVIKRVTLVVRKRCSSAIITYDILGSVKYFLFLCTKVLWWSWGWWSQGHVYTAQC